MQINVAENQVLLTVKSALYPLEAVYNAAYVFLNRAFVFLDEKKSGEILITLKAREKMTKQQLAGLAGEFNNELLHSALRNEISRRNQKLREYIVGRALIGALGQDQEDTAAAEEYQEEFIEEWKGDDLGISLPWEKQAKTAKK